MAPFLIYGANGYTGGLCAEHAVSRGLRPILAGRDTEKVRAVASPLALDWRAFPLDDAAKLRDGLAGVRAVLHVAGPFSATARPMAEACLAAGVHYVDVTGEIDVFEALAGMDARAKAACVTLLPGAGFDVVPSDCLAAHVVGRLPGAVRLKLSIGGFGGLSGVSRGTAKTMLEAIGSGVRVRRGGLLIELPAAPRGAADFGYGPRPTVGVSWGDVSTAWRSTGVPDIEVAFEATSPMRRAAAMPRPLRSLLGWAPVQGGLRRLIETRLPPGPTPEQRAGARSLFLAEAWDASGRVAASRLETVEGYTLTAMTAVEIVRRAAIGETPAGCQTPATAFGADFILSFEGSVRTDVC
ncbi:saccharopine dehydrogenase family protein [Hansschlegelia zhihuaiae]|uniref:Saccharopine dehydrogenase n=1 Tax=Hansschlegelia zhihuaiae TaxID=405005 RepID=A0A4Q0MKF0_9HYPH|nr:saccharopine dehydrogenase NADP-binding domain-containing protein [Hansschlegelia zhihuaiae]RXF73913.1 saccharopine dehydrogenase [Hansschlegelia zhihuaiae]